MKSIFTAAVLFFGLQAHADLGPTVNHVVTGVAKSMTVNFDLDWQVGDSADYKLSGGIIQGTLRMLFREKTEQGFWVQQDADLGFMGKQKVEILFDRTTGQVLKLIVNGQEQTPPSGDDLEVIETRREKVRVPKGEFDALYAKVKSRSENTESEVWLNPNVIPLGGMIKQIQQSQMGPITIELTDFKKQ